MSLFAAYTYVFIPSTASLPLEERSESSSGGLTDDSLQRMAKLHFSSGDFDGEVRLEAVREQVRQGKVDPSMLSTEFMQSMRDMGAQVEIISLAIPHESNGYIGVSLYCDGSAIAKGRSENTRATAIARSCGYKDLRVLGDAFISRYYDNESSGAEVEDWVRRSIAASECDVDAMWVRACATLNAGRNMSSFTSSGSMEKSLQALQGGGHETSSESYDPDAKIAWSQSLEDLELVILFETVVAPKDVKIKFKPKNLHISVPESALPILTAKEIEMKEKLQSGPDGAELFDRVVTDDCTWCIEKDKDGTKSKLTVTLTKGSSRNWSVFVN